MSGGSSWEGYQQRGPWPHVIDDEMYGPLFARCTPAHYAACGALADVGPYLPIEPQQPSPPENAEEIEQTWKINTPARDFPLEVTERRYFMTDYLKGNAYGWQVFGTRWEEFAGHSPWNYEPIGSSYYLFDYINTGAWRTLVYGLRRDRHTRDVRAYKIDGTDVFGQKTYANFRANNVAEDYASRRALWPTGEEVEKYSQGRYGRSGWFLPNPAHCNLDELYDLYCLFGDQRAREGMRNIAAYGGVWVGGADRRVAPHRDSGWCFRSLLRYYDLTGDKDAENYLKPAVDHFWDFARSRRSDPTIVYDNNWFFDVWTRAIVMGCRITGDERLRDLAIGACVGRDTSKNTWPTLNAYCWEQTGDAKYFSEKWPSYARLGGYFPACAGWMWGQPREDKTPPAAVKDLAAAVDNGVKLTWTAPGDDGDEGTASAYQVKYDDQPLVERADGKGAVNFWAAINCTGEPKPAKAGTRQSFTVTGLSAGTWYFALKSRDELNNQSGLSNVVKLVVP